MQLATALLLALLLRFGPGRLTGTVRDSETGAPVAGAVVEVGDLHTTTETGADGRYSISGLPAGPHPVRMARYGYLSRTVDVFIAADGAVQLDVRLEPRALPVAGLTVLPPARRSLSVEAGGEGSVGFRSLLAREIGGRPTIAEADVAAAFAAAPDLSADPESPTSLHVRGGSGDQNLVLLDGAPVYSPYHSSGSFSALNPDALGSVGLYAGVVPARYGDALSGVMSAHVAEPGRDRMRSRGTVTLMSSGITLDGPVGAHGGLVLGMRSGVSPSGDAGSDQYLVHRGSDLIGKLSWGARRDTFALLAFRAGDQLSFSAAVPAEPATAGATASGARVLPPPRNRFDWASETLSASWTRAASERVRLGARAWSASYRARIDWPSDSLPLHAASTRRGAGVEAELTRTETAGVTVLGAGLEAERLGFSLLAADAGGSALLGIHGSPANAHLYIDVDRRLSARWSMASGLRAVLLSSGVALLEPRVSLRVALEPRTTLALGYGRAHQFVQSAENQESLVQQVFGGGLPVATDGRDRPVATSDQVSAELNTLLAPRVRLQLYAYGRRLSGLVLVAASTGQPFADDRLTLGAGDALGFGGVLEGRTARLDGTLSYGYSDVRRVAGALEYTPLAEPLHRSMAALGYRVGGGASLSTKLLAEWGRPGTMLRDVVSWEGCIPLDGGCEIAGSPQHSLGALNAYQTPVYLRWDVGARQELRLARGRLPSLTAYLVVANLLGRVNVRGYAVDPAGASHPIEMWPRSILTAGLSWHP